MNKKLSLLFLSLVFSGSFSNLHSGKSSKSLRWVKAAGVVAATVLTPLCCWLAYKFLKKDLIVRKANLGNYGSFISDFESTFKSQNPNSRTFVGDSVLADEKGNLYYRSSDDAPIKLSAVKNRLLPADFVSFCLKTGESLKKYFIEHGKDTDVLSKQLENLERYHTANEALIKDIKSRTKPSNFASSIEDALKKNEIADGITSQFPC